MGTDREAVIERLKAIRQAREFNEEDEADAVAEAREAGISWADISDALGKPKTVLFRRYRFEE